MNDDESVSDGLRSLARMAASRGRSSVKKRLSATRQHLHRRQLEQDRRDFWVRLGKTAMRLTEQGELSHPEIDRAIARIRELEAEMHDAFEQNASQELASERPSD